MVEIEPISQNVSLCQKAFYYYVVVIARSIMIDLFSFLLNVTKERKENY